ncbi:histone H1-like [Aphidius gifuensis]|uniref:histone H1-like n=1 Tax=Aphidius gifuensis TaxID=684658 RepID=UPI001CDCA756|nr:histone H1-like [Aphidius gifuensis]
MADKSATPAPEDVSAKTESVKKAVAPKATKAKTPKSPKAVKAVKAPKAHPSTADMVKAAVKALAERNGSSLQAIKKYIAANYKLDTEKHAQFIKKYLKSAVISGDLVQTKGKGASGSFKLAVIKKATKAAEPKPKVVKKPASPKKAPVAKKPAVNKKTETAKAIAKKVTVPKKTVAAVKKPIVEKKTKTAPAKIVKPKAPKSPKAKKATKAPTAKPKSPKPKKAAVAKTTKKSPAKK